MILAVLVLFQIIAHSKISPSDEPAIFSKGAAGVVAKTVKSCPMPQHELPQVVRQP